MSGITPNLSARSQRITEESNLDYILALDDFKRARKRAAVTSLLGRLSGKSLELLSFQEVTDKLKLVGQHNAGLQDIPVEAIIGSVGRVKDFDRDFLPLQESDAHRWARVKAATMEGKQLPPIDVYKIGESYFVSDGNHRVSIARQQGWETIPAMVTEVHTRAPLPDDAQPDDLIVAAEYADFLEQTRLDKDRPEANLQVGIPGQYRKLEQHIAVHRCFLEANGVQVCRTTPEAARLWYDEAYLPIVETIRERAILRDFPTCTETELYIWITENQERLREELGWEIQPDAVSSKLAAEIDRGTWSLHLRAQRNVLDGLSSPLRKNKNGGAGWVRQRTLDRYSDQLFTDILVPVNLESDIKRGMAASVKQATVVALNERGEIAPDDQPGSQLLGLTVISDESRLDKQLVTDFQEEFQRICRQAGLEGTLALEEGDLKATLRNRAIVADLIVLGRQFVADEQDQTKGMIDLIRTLKPADRPVLLAREWTSKLKRILLVLDDEAEIDMTIFLAAYLAERWRDRLFLLARGAGGDGPDEVASKASRYLALHEVDAPLLFAEQLKAEVIGEKADEHDCDLIVMDWPATGKIFGRPSADVIQLLLDNCRQPILLCP